jgi:hypothetical protein
LTGRCDVAVEADVEPFGCDDVPQAPRISARPTTTSVVPTVMPRQITFSSIMNLLEAREHQRCYSAPQPPKGNRRIFN